MFVRYFQIKSYIPYSEAANLTQDSAHTCFSIFAHQMAQQLQSLASNRHESDDGAVM